MTDAGLATIILLPVASVVAMTLGAVRFMKVANREAQHRIAAGEFPDFAAVIPGSSIYDDATAPQGPAVEHHHRATGLQLSLGQGNALVPLVIRGRIEPRTSRL